PRACPTTPAPAWWSPRWAGGTPTTRTAAAPRRPPRRRSPRWGTHRPSTTTASRSRRSPDQAVVEFRVQVAQHGLVEPGARHPAALHRAQHGGVGGLLVARRAGDL